MIKVNRFNTLSVVEHLDNIIDRAEKAYSTSGSEGPFLSDEEYDALCELRLFAKHLIRLSVKDVK